MVGAALAECRLADLRAALDASEAAYGAGEESEFRSAAGLVASTENCLSEPATPAASARAHRMRGLVALADRSRQQATAAFSAARLADPSMDMPASIAPTHGPVARAWAAAEIGADPTTALAAPATGMLMFDGRVSLARPTARATLAQLVTVEGSAVTSAVLAPDDPMFAYPLPPPVEVRAPVTVTIEPTVPDVLAAAAPAAEYTPLVLPIAPPRPRTSVPLAIASGATLLAAAGLYAASYATYQDYDPRSADAELRDLNHALVITDSAALAVGVGLGAAAFISGSW